MNIPITVNDMGKDEYRRRIRIISSMVDDLVDDLVKETHEEKRVQHSRNVLDAVGHDLMLGIYILDKDEV